MNILARYFFSHTLFIVCNFISCFTRQILVYICVIMYKMKYNVLHFYYTQTPIKYYELYDESYTIILGHIIFYIIITQTYTEKSNKL